MANGKFSSTTYKGAGAGYYRYIEVVWKSTNDTANNKSTVSWTAYCRSTDNATTTSYVKAKNIVVTINGKSEILVGTTAEETYKDKKLGSGSVVISHNTNGKKSVNVAISAEFYTYGSANSTYSGTIAMSPNPVYLLSVSAGTGSTIKVNRTTCAGSGSTGELTDKAKLYYGDKLKITFASSSGYSINGHTVNSSSFTSGGTHTVSGDVTVVSTATATTTTTTKKASTISATNARVGDQSSVTISSQDSTYQHEVKYSFEDLKGNVHEKTSDRSFQWKIPDAFREKIYGEESKTCTLTCYTYNGNNLLGTSTCKISVRLSAVDLAPRVSMTVVDSNSVTKSLTGDEKILIKYKSTAKCAITATPKFSASIKSVKVNGEDVDMMTNDGGVKTGSKFYENVAENTFSCKVTDSLSRSNTIFINPTVIEYIPLTCEPTIKRPSPTGNELIMSVTGHIYNGSFDTGDVRKNTLLNIKYRYKATGEAEYSNWINVDLSENTIIYATPQSTPQYSNEGIVLTGFDYKVGYEFEVEVSDGAKIGEESYTLSTVRKKVNVNRGIPIFDWGESDFNVNVTLKTNDVEVNGDIKINENEVVGYYNEGSFYKLYENGKYESLIKGEGDKYYYDIGNSEYYSYSPKGYNQLDGSINPRKRFEIDRDIYIHKTQGLYDFDTGNNIIRVVGNGGTYVGDANTTTRLCGENIYLNTTSETVTSDKRLKTDIQPFSDTHERLFKSLKPTNFKYTEGTSGRTHYGFIAQEVRDAALSVGLTTQDIAAFVEMDSDREGFDAEYALRYDEFIALNTYMIQRCLSEIADLRQANEALKLRLEKVEKELDTGGQ